MVPHSGIEYMAGGTGSHRMIGTASLGRQQRTAAEKQELWEGQKHKAIPAPTCALFPLTDADLVIYGVSRQVHCDTVPLSAANAIYRPRSPHAAQSPPRLLRDHPPSVIRAAIEKWLFQGAVRTGRIEVLAVSVPRAPDTWALCRPAAPQSAARSRQDSYRPVLRLRPRQKNRRIVRESRHGPTGHP